MNLGDLKNSGRDKRQWWANGAPRVRVDRVADRLIQRQRKAGNIKVGPPYPTWTWVGK